MSCIEDRNKLSHIYKLEMFDLLAKNMLQNYDSILQTIKCIENYLK